MRLILVLEIEIHMLKIATQVMDTITFQPELSKRIRRCRKEVMSYEKKSSVEKRIRGQKDDKEILIFSSSIWAP